MWDAITNHISEATGEPFALLQKQSIGGGCINDTYRLKGKNRGYFLKLNQADALEMFEAEADGLREIAATKTIRIPSPICTGMTGRQAYLIMEHLPLGGGRAGSQFELGERLAKLHSFPQAQFGWHRDNTIGSTPQPNPKSNDWVGFLREYRLGFQFHLAKQNGMPFRDEEELLRQMDYFFADYQPKPALLHGDLWSGNVAYDDQGAPVIFDPATYHGDREAEFGLTEMFGGFGADFWNGYESILPLEAGYATRKLLYRLYHLLNHFNLFGSSYAESAQSIIEQLLRSL
jgi:fructosamine-3-kinase